MSIETTEVLVVGAGQAGVAMSEHLGKAGISHVVLERSRIAERWRTERWDSLRANGPAWHDRFPGAVFQTTGPDGFPGKDEVAAYFEDYARRIDAPIRCGVTVTDVRRHDGRPGFRVTTTAGEIDARCVVAATGAFQTPVMPDLVPAASGLTQMHSTAYRNPDQLAEGAVLVVGAGSSGTQIAEELMRAGRQVYLSIGPHHRPPRSYRGRDFCWWLGVLNKWDTEATPGVEHTTIAVSGADGGHTIDFRRLAHGGMTLVGRTQRCDGGVIHFAPDLAANIAAGDANYLSLLDEADAYVARNGLNLPEDPQARRIEPDPACLTAPLASLDLAAAGVTTIIWATGFTADYSWLPEAATDDAGRPAHQRGVSAEPGIYYLGLPWQTRRGSSFIWGVWYDARYIADHIAKQRGYFAYQGPADAPHETEDA